MHWRLTCLDEEGTQRRADCWLFRTELDRENRMHPFLQPSGALPSGMNKILLTALGSLIVSCGGGGADDSRPKAAMGSTPALFAMPQTSGEPAVQPNPGIVITAQPRSMTVDTGQPATFSVAAAGSRSLLYQWFVDDVRIAGASSASYTTSPLSIADTGSLVKVAISDGAQTVTSMAATLTVMPKETGVTPPDIVSPPRPQSVVVGQSGTFFALVKSSRTPSYQWRRNGTDIPKATAASYTTQPATIKDNGDRYSVRVTSAVGSVTSPDASLTVTAAPTAAVLQGGDRASAR